MQLETERLLIREWLDSDLEHYLFMSKDVGYNVFAYPGQFLVKSDQEALEKIRIRQKVFNESGLGKYPVFLRSTGEFIGTCGFETYTLDGTAEVELGYRLLLSHWGKGYATEAARAVVDYGLQNLKLQRIIAFAILQNPQSLKIIEKLGFQYLRVFVHAGFPHRLYEVRSTKKPS